MAPQLKRLFLGQSLPKERNQVFVVLGFVTLSSAVLGPGVLSLSFLLASLISWQRLTIPLALLLSLPHFGFGVGPLVMAAVSIVSTEVFRDLHTRQQRLATSRQELLQTLVHELRNPLFAAKGTIDNLAARFKEIETQELEIQLAMASEAMQSINQEVDDLTQLLRLESGRLISRPVNTTLGRIYRSLRGRHPAHSLADHRLQFTGEDCQVLCDPLLIVQALDKLVSNALVHAPGGLISVTGRTEGQRVIVDVKDQGPGIPPEARDLVFDRFRQLSANSIGFGLGLFLARQYVLCQDGVLTLEESENGCLFRMSLPKGQDENQDSYS